MVSMRSIVTVMINSEGCAAVAGSGGRSPNVGGSECGVRRNRRQISLDRSLDRLLRACPDDAFEEVPEHHVERKGRERRCYARHVLRRERDKIGVAAHEGDMSLVCRHI